MQGCAVGRHIEVATLRDKIDPGWQHRTSHQSVPILSPALHFSAYRSRSYSLASADAARPVPPPPLRPPPSPLDPLAARRRPPPPAAAHALAFLPLPLPCDLRISHPQHSPSPPSDTENPSRTLRSLALPSLPSISGVHPSPHEYPFPFPRPLSACLTGYAHPRLSPSTIARPASASTVS